MMDDRTPDQILTEVGNPARTAFNAELDFIEWRADHERHALHDRAKPVVERRDK